MLSLWNPSAAASMWGFPELRRTLLSMDRLRSQMDRLLVSDGDADVVRSPTWPQVSVNETAEAYEVRAEVPGVKSDDLDVSVTAHTVSISGHYDGEVPQGASTHVKERQAYRFSRAYSLPTRVDPDNVKATLTNGVLHLVVPKAAETRPKQITVKAS